jgi:surface protein
MNHMFFICGAIQKLKLCSFNTSAVTNMSEMFYETDNLRNVYVGPSWTTANANTAIMFYDSGVSAVSQSATCAVDAENPATISLATSKTTKSINVVATASAESGIAKYEFSKDSGTTWIDNGTNNTYSFSGLTKNTAYPIKVRVTSTVGKLTTTDVTNVTTNNIATPTFAESGTTTKTVTITYPAGCGSTLTCSYVKDGGTSVSVTSTTTSVTFTASGSLVANVTDGTNNVSSSYTANLTQIYNFTYTGQVQTFTAPEAGQYQIEAWGAQGGLSGGAGGYAIGKINLTSGQILYIVVGGQGGGSGNTYAGGYNGGGEANYTTSYPSSAGGGGGATHVAKVTGLLSTLSSQTSQVVIVAGGGGGQSENTTSTCGVGGGITGTNATAQYYGGGGSQTTGGTKQCDNATAGSFGQGGHAETLTDTGSSRYYGGGGGGGYYGGGGGCWSGTITLSGSGGGGSGYIGNSDLTSKHMTCYNCTTSTDTATKTQTTTNVSSTPTSDYAKNGNGYIRITYYK